jgi:hypothetical protein
MRTFRILTLLLCLTAALWSTPILTLDPPGGAIAGTQGSTIGWGFSIAPDATLWTLITAVQMNVAAIGTADDYLSAWVANNAFAIAPGAVVFSQTFTPGTPGTATGVAAVLLNSGAPLGLFSGVMDIGYELYDADPFQGGNLQVAGQSFMPSFQITVNPAAVPEPASMSLMLGALCLAWGRLIAQCR